MSIVNVEPETSHNSHHARFVFRCVVLSMKRTNFFRSCLHLSAACITAAMSSNAFDSKMGQWIAGVTAKQAHTGRPTGAEQQTLQDPRSKNPLATQWHGRQLNDHVYTGPLDKDHAVFAYKPLSKGPMANFLAASSNVPVKQEPTGRVRAVEGYYEQ